jgi:hypothetical protein
MVGAGTILKEIVNNWTNIRVFVGLTSIHSCGVFWMQWSTMHIVEIASYYGRSVSSWNKLSIRSIPEYVPSVRLINTNVSILHWVLTTAEIFVEHIWSDWNLTVMSSSTPMFPGTVHPCDSILEDGAHSSVGVALRSIPGGYFAFHDFRKPREEWGQSCCSSEDSYLRVCDVVPGVTIGQYLHLLGWSILVWHASSVHTFPLEQEAAWNATSFFERNLDIVLIMDGKCYLVWRQRNSDSKRWYWDRRCRVLRVDIFAMLERECTESRRHAFAGWHSICTLSNQSRRTFAIPAAQKGCRVCGPFWQQVTWYANSRPQDQHIGGRIGNSSKN